MERIGLTDALAALRTELSEAIVAAADESLRFSVGEATMEFQVDIEKKAGATGGARFWVVNFGGEVSRTRTETHILTLTLKPVSADGGPVLTGGSVPE